MSKLLDKICGIRDLVTSKDYSKLKFYNMKMGLLKEEIHRQMSKKAEDYSHQLDFTAQDLREMAQDIRNLLNDWSNILSPDENIKAIYADKEGEKVKLDPFFSRVIPVMTARTNSIQALTELLSLVEYMAVFLYFIEHAAEDEFALEYTERVI